VKFTEDSKKLYWVVIKEERKGYCLLLCHLPCSSCEEAIRIAFQGYGHRWKIEEVHSQVKSDYNLEDICLHRYRALKALNSIFWSDDFNWMPFVSGAVRSARYRTINS